MPELSRQGFTKRKNSLPADVELVVLLFPLVPSSLNSQISCGQVKSCCIRKTVFIRVPPCPSVVERILV
jgi:hypothetical protein